MIGGYINRAHKTVILQIQKGREKNIYNRNIREEKINNKNILEVSLRYVSTYYSWSSKHVKTYHLKIN